MGCKPVGRVLIREGADDMMNFRLAPPSVRLAVKKSPRCHHGSIWSLPVLARRFLIACCWSCHYISYACPHPRAPALSAIHTLGTESTGAPLLVA